MLPSAGRGRRHVGSGAWWLAGYLHRGRGALGAPGVSCTDAPEIEAMLSAVTASVPDLTRRLSRHLVPLVRRSVPPRAIEAAPVPRAARLRFADGTSVVVKSAAPGDVGVLALAMSRGSVRPTACTPDPEGGVRLVFTWPGDGGGLSLRVVGLDQPD